MFGVKVGFGLAFRAQGLGFTASESRIRVEGLAFRKFWVSEIFQSFGLLWSLGAYRWGFGARGL